MAGNAELFINICSFLKNYVYDVMLDCEPSESIKDVTKELIFALQNLSRKIECNVSSTSVQKYNSSIDLGACSSIEKKGSNKSQPHYFACESVLSNSSSSNIDDAHKYANAAPKSKAEKSKIHEPKNKKLSRNLVSRTSTSNGNSCSLNHVSNEDLKIIEEKIAVCFPNVLNKWRKSIPPGIPRRSESNTTNNPNLPLMEPIPEKCKEIIFTSKSSNSSTESPGMNGVSQVDIDVKETNKKSASFILNEDSDPIHREFIELNRCLEKKLLGNAFYCWVCRIRLESRAAIQIHIGLHYAAPAKTSLIVSELCDICPSAVISPVSVVNVLKEYHKRNHKSLNTSKVPNYVIGNNKTFVETLFKVHFQNKNAFPNLLAICLPCHVYYNTTLEWAAHLKAYGHFVSGLDKISECNTCFIVVLGSENELFKNNYLGLPEHTKFCKASLL